MVYLENKIQIISEVSIRLCGCVGFLSLASVGTSKVESGVGYMLSEHDKHKHGQQTVDMHNIGFSQCDPHCFRDL